VGEVVEVVEEFPFSFLVTAITVEPNQ
jgi:hypothetical protein